jgi:hypothetical protein
LYVAIHPKHLASSVCEMVCDHSTSTPNIDSSFARFDREAPLKEVELVAMPRSLERRTVVQGVVLIAAVD